MTSTLSLGDAGEDQSAALTYQFENTVDRQTLVLAACLTGSDSYQVRIGSDSSTAHLAREDSSGSVTDLGSFSVPNDTDAHRVRFQVDGDELSARVWDPGEGGAVVVGCVGVGFVDRRIGRDGGVGFAVWCGGDFGGG